MMRYHHTDVEILNENLMTICYNVASFEKWHNGDYTVLLFSSGGTKQYIKHSPPSAVQQHI